MPAPGQANNSQGINAFSGPMGETEPAYGAVERAKVLNRLAPVGSPQAQNAPRRARRAAARGRTAAPAAAAPTSAVPDVPSQAQPDYQAQLQAFWTQLASEPGASEEVKKYAAQVSGAQPV